MVAIYLHVHRRRKGIRIGVGTILIPRAHARISTQLAYATIFVDVGIQIRAPIRCSMSLEGSRNSFLPRAHLRASANVQERVWLRQTT